MNARAREEAEWRGCDRMLMGRMTAWIYPEEMVRYER